MTTASRTPRARRAKGKRTQRPRGNVQQLPSGSWRARATLDRKPVVFGTYRTEDEARQALAQALLDYDRGQLPDVAAGNTPFGKVAEEWFADVAPNGVRAHTLERYRERYDLRVAPRFAAVPVGKITGPALRSWVLELTKDGLSERTVKHYFGIVRQVLSEAAARGLIRSSPADGFKLDKITTPSAFKQPEALSPAQVEVLCSALAAEQHARAEHRAAFNRTPMHRGHDTALLVRTVVYCGAMRKGEAEALNVADLDTARWELRIAASMLNGVRSATKTDAGTRVVEVPAPLRPALAAHVAGRPAWEPLFTSSEGQRVRFDNLRTRGWRQALHAAGLPYMRPHDLRHTGVSIMLALGIPATDVAKAVGHANAGITLSLYAHAIPGSASRVADVLAGALTGTVVPFRKAGAA